MRIRAESIKMHIVTDIIRTCLDKSFNWEIIGKHIVFDCVKERPSAATADILSKRQKRISIHVSLKNVLRVNLVPILAIFMYLHRAISARLKQLNKREDVTKKERTLQ